VIDGARKLGGSAFSGGACRRRPSSTRRRSFTWPERPRIRAPVPKTSADMRAVHARKKRIVGGFARYRVKQLKSADFDLIRGQAHFVDPHTLELGDGRTVEGKHFLISTGSKVSVPPIPAWPTWLLDQRRRPRTRFQAEECRHSGRRDCRVRAGPVPQACRHAGLHHPAQPQSPAGPLNGGAHEIRRAFEDGASRCLRTRRSSECAKDAEASP